MIGDSKRSCKMHYDMEQTNRRTDGWQWDCTVRCVV